MENPTPSTDQKWYDEDDSTLKVNLNSKNHLKKLKQTPTESEITVSEYQQRIRAHFKSMYTSSDETNIFKWADPSLTDAPAVQPQGELDKILQSNTLIANASKLLLQSNILAITQLTPVTKHNKQHSSITTTINFHPTKPEIIVTSGLDKKLKVFEYTPQQDESKLLSCVNTIDMPIYSAKFLNNDSNNLIITGRRKHYFTYDIERSCLQRYEGHFATTYNKIASLERCFVGYNNDTFAFTDQTGCIYLYDVSTHKFKYDIKLQTEITNVCFDNNGYYVYCAGNQSDIYIYDIRKYRSCVNKIADYGNICVLAMDISPNGKYLATGSKSGYVNVYETEQLKAATVDEDVEPVKVFENLTTSCDYVRFNKGSNALGMSSKWKKNALRVANVENMKVYSNFPSFKERMKYPTCFDFSCNDKYFTVGNDEGKAFLYKVDF